MNTRTTTTILVAAGLVVLGASVTDASAQQVECSSAVRNVAAVTNPAGHVITTRYQFDTPNLQPLLSTTIESGEGCLIAHLSGQVRITDNYVAFQVRVDCVPLEGQVPLPLFTTPVVFVAIDPAQRTMMNSSSTPRGRRVQLLHHDSQRDASRRGAGRRRQRNRSATRPTATHLVLTLEYR